MAFKLDFTEKQADAILAMPLSRLIGLEILKLHEERDGLVADIQNYKNILSDRSLLFKVMKTRLKGFRQRFARPRRTELLDAEIKSYVEEVKEEDIVVLIDKFGYTKAVDASQVAKASEDALAEFVHRVKLRNTDKLCAFTAQGNMFQVKAGAIPKCRIKEKGTLIQNLCKVDKEDVILYTSFEELFECQLMFTTKNGFTKLVSGIEFDTARAVVNTTKLDAEDLIISIAKINASDILANDRKVILMTTKGLQTAYLLEEVPELKKTSRGVKAATLDKDDHIAFVGVFGPEDAEFEHKGKQYPVKRFKVKRRGGKPQKINL